MCSLAQLNRLVTDRRGGITIIGAFSLTSIAGIAGIAMETSHGYAVKVDNQRVADAAALAAALTLAADYDHNDAKVQPTAVAIAAANGVAGSSVTAGLPAVVNGKKVITVTIRTSVPLNVTRVITDALSFDVSATGIAAVTPGTSGSTTTVHPNAGACFLSLDSATATTHGVHVSGAATIVGNTNGGCDVQAVRGITVTGSSSILARNIQANGNVVVDGSAYLRAVEVAAGGVITSPTWNTSAIVTAPVANNRHSGRTTPISDPLATGSVQTALARVTTLTNYPVPGQPAALPAPATTSSTTDWAFTASTGTGTGILPAWRSGSVWTVPRGTYNLRNVTISGGAAELHFAPGSTVTIGGNLVATGSTLITVQGDANCPVNGTNCNSFNVAGAMTVEGGGAASSFGHGSYRAGTANFNRSTTFGSGELRVTGTATFGPYTHVIGAGPHSFGRVVAAGSSNTTMGDGAFTVAQDMSVGGSASFRLGTGIKTVGANAAGQSVVIDGSTGTHFGNGNATLTGALEIGGASTVSFGAGNMWFGSRRPANNTICASATVYDAACRAIYLTGSANLSIGDGTFVTTGGIETGGSSTMALGSTANHFIRGNLLLNGAVTFGSGAYTVYGYFTKTASLSATGSNVSFFLFGPIDLSGSASSTFSAPGTDTGAALADILFASLTTSASQYTGNSQNSYTGAVYVPNSPFTISGSGRITSTGCFALIAKTITVSGSGAGASKCAGVAAAGSTTTTTATPATVALIR